MYALFIEHLLGVRDGALTVAATTATLLGVSTKFSQDLLHQTKQNQSTLSHRGGLRGHLLETACFMCPLDSVSMQRLVQDS